MADELELVQKRRNQELERSLNDAASIITRDFLDKLSSYKIMIPSEEDLDIDIAKCAKFYQLSKLVINREENFLKKLTTIVNVASSIKCSIATIIKSDGYTIDYYIGIISKNARNDRESSRRQRSANETAFKGALLGNLTGSELREVSSREIEEFERIVLSNKNASYSAVSGIVGLRDEEDKSIEGYVQGIENLVDSLKGQKYTIVMLADPVDTSEIQMIKQGYEMLYTQLATFSQSSVTMNENDTQTLSKARSTGISEGISKGIALTQSTSKSNGKYFGGSLGVGLNMGISFNVGLNMGKNRGTSETTGRTESNTETTQRSQGTTDSVSYSKNTGRSIQLNYENRSVKELLGKIDKYLERLDECESFGAFNCAAYVIADERETSLAVASNYNALMRGQESGIQASQINSWFKPEDTRLLSRYIRAFVHPRFIQNEQTNIVVTPASLVSGDELAIQIGLPKKSISGITVIDMAPFGRNIVEHSENSLELGNLYHMGHDEGYKGREQKVKIDVQSLAMHTFITGSTGSGKTTVVYSILDKLIEKKIKFMVIEPAKGEYKDRFGNRTDVNVYGTNDKKMPLLRMNPFSFPEDVHVLEHIDRLIEIFNVCWPMYAAMPAVLKDAVERAYIISGWNLETSECRYKDSHKKPLFPTFQDVLNQITVVMDESSYSSDGKGDYKGALCTRLKSLTNGLYGKIFTSNELEAKTLFDSNVIVDLSRVGSSETKSFIMGLLVMKLQEYRMSDKAGSNLPLKHVTVLEEAHNILKRTSTVQSGESSNVLGKSVEMLSNSIAEMRTYGEGFIIADQAPNLMDLSAIRNTNTKIILRLPDLEDRELVGRAANLNEEQIAELSRLKTFVSAVYQNNWLEPVLCHIVPQFKENGGYRYQPTKETNTDETKVLEYLLLPLQKRKELDDKYISSLIDRTYRLPISAEAKIAIFRCMKASEKERSELVRKIMYELFNTKSAFEMVKSKEKYIESWYNEVREVLVPDIMWLPEYDQQKIIAGLVREEAEKNGSQDLGEVLDRFTEMIKR